MTRAADLGMFASVRVEVNVTNRLFNTKGFVAKAIGVDHFYVLSVGSGQSAGSSIPAWASVDAGRANGLIGNSCVDMRQMTNNQCKGRTLEMGGLDIIKFGSGIYRMNTKRDYPFF